MQWIYHDGGRKAAGFTGLTGDCVTRAIAIATTMPYTDVYNALNAEAQFERGHRTRGGGRRKSAARTGVYKPTLRRYLESRGWVFTPTMGIGTGCRVHLRDGELPMGRLVVSVSKHMCAVIDGVIYDTHDPSRDGMRCVYGYFRLEG